MVVTVLATTITWQIVGAADAQVSDRPASELNVAAPQFDTTTLPPASAPTTTTSVLPSTSLVEGSTTTSEATTTTVVDTSTTTDAKSAPTTTDASSKWTLETIHTSGGTLVVRYRSDEVEYQAATPSPGFRVEVDDPGPPTVEVEFESEDSKVEIHVKWDGGRLSVETSESDEED